MRIQTLNTQRRVLRDRLLNVGMQRARTSAVHVIDGLQNIQDTYGRPLVAEQLAGLACAFLLACEELGVPARDVLEVGDNLLTQARFRDATHFEGLRLYLRHHLSLGEVR